MKSIAFHMQDVPDDERIALWEHLNQQYFGGLSISRPEPCAMDGSLEIFDLGDCRTMRITCSRHDVVRRLDRKDDYLDTCCKILFLIDGSATIHIQDTSASIAANAWALYDARERYALKFPGSARFLAVSIPKKRLGDTSRTPLITSAELESRDPAFASLLTTFLQSLHTRLDALHDEAAPALGEALVRLMAHALTTAPVHEERATVLPEVLRSRVKAFIEQHLSDTELSIDRIAAAMRCSKRYLHRVFESEGVGIERYIWKLRLIHSQKRITSPAEASLSIAEISDLHGFKSSSHFSHLFKKEFGVTPSAMRENAVHSAIHSAARSAAQKLHTHDIDSTR